MRSWLSAAIELAYPASSIGVSADELWMNEPDGEEEVEECNSGPDAGEDNDDDEDSSENEDDAALGEDDEPTVRANGDEDDAADEADDGSEETDADNDKLGWEWECELAGDDESSELRNSSWPALEFWITFDGRPFDKYFVSRPVPESAKKQRNKHNNDK